MIRIRGELKVENFRTQSSSGIKKCFNLEDIQMQQHRVSVVNLLFHDVLILQWRQSAFPPYWFRFYVLLFPGSKAMMLEYHPCYSEADPISGDALDTKRKKENNNEMTLQTSHCISVINAFLVWPDVVWKTLSIFQCFPPSRVKQTTRRLNIWVEQGKT